MKVVITGASGKLGGYLVEEARRRGWEFQAWSRGSDVRVELQDLAAVERQLEQFQPQAILHSAALSTASECFQDPEAAHRINVRSSVRLARWCADRQARMVYVSTDMVFDGEDAPYSENSEVTPATAYGRSKATAEQAVLQTHPRALVARVSLLCGRTKTARKSFFDGLLEQLQTGQTVRGFCDEWRTPLYLGDAAWALAEILRGEGTGVLHLAGPQRLSRLEMCQKVAAALGHSNPPIESMSRLQGGFDEPRQKDLSLTSLRIKTLLPQFQPRTLEEAIVVS